MVRFIGIDYGIKRVGLAISDEGGTIAFPKEVILNDKSIFNKIAETLKKENISEIVMGESADFKGRPNIVAKEIEFFILELKKKFKLPVHKQKEFLTSVEARRFKENKKNSNKTQAHSRKKEDEIGHMDASAAALILQRYLDKINKLYD